MIIIRIFNNNAVAVKNQDNLESIVLGSGVGFNKKTGDLVNIEKIEKSYFIQDELQTKFLSLLENTNEEHFSISQHIIQYAEKKGFKISNQVIISLTDHISFAIQRSKNEIKLPNLMLAETKILYPNEYEIGLYSLNYIYEKLNVKLDQDEAAYIALHIISSVTMQSTTNTVNTLKFVKGSLDILESTYLIDTNNDDFDRMRMTTHLKFLAQRIFNNQEIISNQNDDMYDYLILQNTNHNVFIQNYKKYLLEEFNYKLSKQESVYLLIHITKFLSK